MPIPDGSSQVKEFTGILLSGESYPLVDEIDAQTHFKKASWKVELKGQANKLPMRSSFNLTNVRPGELEDEWFWFQDDFSGGISGELEPGPHTLNMCEGCNGLTPGTIRPTQPVNVGWSLTAPAELTEPINPVLFNGLVFTFHGRYVYTTPGGALDKDFTAGILVQTAEVHNNELIVGLGGSTTKAYKRNTAGTWTQASDATYFDHLTHTGDSRMWRATGTSQVSNIAATDAPLTLANWSGGITVGQAGNGVTALGAQGLSLIVAKPEGRFRGDASAFFMNELPQFEAMPHPDNGKRMLVNGADIFYPTKDAGLRHSLGSGSDELGPSNALVSISPERSPSSHIVSLAERGGEIWAVAADSGYPRAVPTKVYKVTVGPVYTDITAAVTDSKLAVGGSLANLPGDANSYVLVGYSAAFWGIAIQLAGAKSNANASVLSVAFSTSSSFTAVSYSEDGTTLPTLATPCKPGAASLQADGLISVFLTSDIAGNFAAQTINGTSAFWLKLSFSASLDANARIGELRVLTEAPRGWIYRGHPTPSGFTWDLFDSTASGSSTSSGGPGDAFYRGVGVYGGVNGFGSGQVLVASGTGSDAMWALPPPNPAPLYSQNYTAAADAPFGVPAITARTSRLDMEMPTVSKEFLSIIVKGKTIDASHTVTVNYRLNTSTTWVTGGTVTSSPSTITLSGVSGYSIQFQVVFNSFVTTNEQAPEVNLLGCVFRTLQTEKEVHTVLINLPPAGNTDAQVMFTNLLALLGTTAVTYVDPWRRSMTADVQKIGAAETYLNSKGLPGVAAEVLIEQA